MSQMNPPMGRLFSLPKVSQRTGWVAIYHYLSSRSTNRWLSLRLVYPVKLGRVPGCVDRNEYGLVFECARNIRRRFTLGMCR